MTAQTDRELLEAAARAAGIEVAAVVADGIPHRFGGGYWNPLRDDGDALRLAVKLGINLEFVSQVLVIARGLHEDRRHHGGDYAAATRRAIVRAAAELGAHKEGA